MVKGNLESLEQSYMNSRKKEFKIKTFEKEPWEKLIVPKMWGRVRRKIFSNIIVFCRSRTQESQ
jgi:hypothetical protein